MDEDATSRLGIEPREGTWTGGERHGGHRHPEAAVYSAESAYKLRGSRSHVVNLPLPSLLPSPILEDLQCAESINRVSTAVLPCIGPVYSAYPPVAGLFIILTVGCSMPSGDLDPLRSCSNFTQLFLYLSMTVQCVTRSGHIMPKPLLRRFRRHAATPCGV